MSNTGFGSTTMNESTETATFFRKVYLWMCAGLIVSGVTALAVASSSNIVGFVERNPFVFLGLLFLQIFVVSRLVDRLPDLTVIEAMAFFVGYCFLTGLTTSSICLVFSFEDIFVNFLITAGMFGAMSLFGYLTRSDLSTTRHFLLMFLIGLMLTFFVISQYFDNDEGFFWFSVAGVVLFSGLTSADSQRLRETNILGNEGTDADTKEAIHGALILYLDFINIFLQLMRVSRGKKRRR